MDDTQAMVDRIEQGFHEMDRKTAQREQAKAVLSVWLLGKLLEDALPEKPSGRVYVNGIPN